jgi:hypothetical protein
VKEYGRAVRVTSGFTCRPRRQRNPLRAAARRSGSLSAGRAGSPAFRAAFSPSQAENPPPPSWHGRPFPGGSPVRGSCAAPASCVPLRCGGGATRRALDPDGSRSRRFRFPRLARGDGAWLPFAAVHRAAPGVAGPAAAQPHGVPLGQVLSARCPPRADWARPAEQLARVAPLPAAVRTRSSWPSGTNDRDRPRPSAGRSRRNALPRCNPSPGEPGCRGRRRRGEREGGSRFVIRSARREPSPRSGGRRAGLVSVKSRCSVEPALLAGGWAR